MRIAIAGAGAIGSIVAAHLARAGHDPLVVARGATYEAIRREGLVIEGPSERIEARVRVSDRPDGPPPDVLITGFKGQDWPDALPLVERLAGPDTVIVPLLNGVPWWYFDGVSGAHAGRVVESVDPGGALLAALPGRRVIGAVVYIGGERIAPNRVAWNTSRRLVLGEADGTMTARLEALATVLRGAGMTIATTPAIRAEIWSKILGNATYNPVSALTGETLGAIAADPDLKRIVRAIMEECHAVATALGAAPPVSVEERLVVSPLAAGIRTSMLQDMEQGRSLELAGIVDAVVELGRVAACPTPVLAAIGALAAHRARMRGVTRISA